MNIEELILANQSPMASPIHEPTQSPIHTQPENEEQHYLSSDSEEETPWEVLHTSTNWRSTSWSPPQQLSPLVLTPQEVVEFLQAHGSRFADIPGYYESPTATQQE